MPISDGVQIINGVAVKIRNASSATGGGGGGASFSSLFRSRRPSVDPSEIFSSDCVNVAQPASSSNSKTPPPAVAMAATKTVALLQPNFVETSTAVQSLKRSRDGNFVKLNLNGHGRKKFKFLNTKAKKSRRMQYPRASKSRRRKLLEEGSPPTNSSEFLELEEISKNRRKVAKYRSEMVDSAVAAVREIPSDENLEKLLRISHGHDSFREGQLETIKRVIAGESVMLVLPTGAGKSLCYQLPALVLPGITLVISPLLALMVDQLRQLVPVIPGGLLSSNQTNEEAASTLEMLREGKIKVLFVSPERLLSSKFLSVLGDALPISLVVIDEAHCVSEWSHNFRPSYLRLRKQFLGTKLNVNCVLAMTATATKQTLNDVMCALEIPPANLIQTCQIRQNLQLLVTISENRLKDLLMLMKTSPLVEMKSIIIYCMFQAETDLLSKYLCDNNIIAKGYHSAIPAKDRSRIQELFCTNKIRVVVATVAFGMGLNKTDVDAVIHYSLPKSLEQYIQETGRAGRDGRLSYCHLLLDDLTYYKIRSLSYSDGVDEYTITKVLSEIFLNEVPIGKTCSLMKEFATQKFDVKEEVLSTILTLLEVGGVQYIHILPELNVTCTLSFHKTSPGLLSEKNTAVAAILKNSGSIKGRCEFDIPKVSNAIGMSTSDFLNQLHSLKSMGEIMYDLKNPAFCFVVLKKPDDFCSLTRHLTSWLSNVESCKLRKLDCMFRVANFAVKECKRLEGCSNSMHTPCIQRKILDYFSSDHCMLTDDYPTGKGESSRFLRADIKVFLQNNSHEKFTPRAVARIMHGIPSPAFPSASWSKSHFWGRYSKVEFPEVMQAATLELMNSVKKGVDL